MNVHCLQHVPFEGPGYIEGWLKKNGATLSFTRFYDPGCRLPALEELDALLVMGGPMGVYDEAEYPWLAEEKRFIRGCIDAGKKVLGICLGAQLLAVVLGAPVHAAPNKEIGWFAVQPTEACRQLPWLYELFREQPQVLHWHGDQFELPEGSAELLISEANGHQLLYHSERVIGLQFHLEATEHTLQGMMREVAMDPEGSAHVQTAAELLEGQPQMATCHGILAALLARWLMTID